jgi:hypothetical protein
MAWKTPKIVEVQVGMDIYASAARKWLRERLASPERVLACSWEALDSELQMGSRSPHHKKFRPGPGFLGFRRSAIIGRRAPRSHGPRCSPTNSVVRQMARPRNHWRCETAGSWIRARDPLCACGARLLRSFELSTRQSAARREWLELSFASQSPLIRRSGARLLHLTDAPCVSRRSFRRKLSLITRQRLNFFILKFFRLDIRHAQ